MRELHGVVGIELGNVDGLKAHALLFDKFRFFSISPRRDYPTPFVDEEWVDFSFLYKSNLIELVNEDFLQGWKNQDEVTKQANNFDAVLKAVREPTDRTLLSYFGRDLFSRMLAAHIGDSPTISTVPICRNQLPSQLALHQVASSSETVLTVSIETFPVPGPSAAWQDILDFKSETQDKQWDLRRFLHDLATKKQTAAEIKEHIDYSLNQYQDGLRRLNIKAVRSAVVALAIPAADIAFNLGGNHVASIAGAVDSICKTRLDLIEGEVKVPGREVAYIYDAKKRFGGNA